MGWRQVSVLYLVLAVLVALYARERPATPEAEPARPPRPRFLQLSAADVVGIRLTRGGRTVVMERDGRGWRLVEPPGAALPGDLPTGFLQALLTSEEIDRVAEPGADLAPFGLEEEADRIELTRSSGERVVVALGGTNPTGTALYARHGVEGGVVLIGRQVRDYADLIYNALPHGAVPAGTAEGRIGTRTMLLFDAGTV